MSDRVDILPDEELDLGLCCACQGTENVRNIIMLDRLAPISGTGWGCFTCGLAMDGAIAVVCDTCLENNTDLQYVCLDLPGNKLRAPITENFIPFGHDYSKHTDEVYDLGGGI